MVGKALNNRRFLITVALGVTANGAAGTLTVDAAYNPAVTVKKGDVIMIEATKEVVRVTADRSPLRLLPSAAASTPAVRAWPWTQPSRARTLRRGYRSALEEGSGRPDRCELRPE